MIDLMTLFIKVMLIAIVLVSIMNVMIMAVYERIREIGTIAAIGTLPGKILYYVCHRGFFPRYLRCSRWHALSGLSLCSLLTWPRSLSALPDRQGLYLSPTIGLSDILVTCLIVIVVAVLGSLQPALKASRMEPIEALRHV